MAADNELRLLSKVVSTREITSCLKRGVKPEWFLDDDNRRVWQFLVEHNTNYGEVPTAVTVKDNWPNFRLLKVEDTLDYLLDTMAEFIRWKLTREGLTKSVEIMSDTRDTEAVLMAMAATLAEVNAEGIPGTNEVNLVEDPMSRYDAYKALQTDGGMLGIPTGFAKIDEATAGLQPGQLVTIIASPKAGKSQLAMVTGINVHRDAGLPVLFQSFEMSNSETQQRHDAARSKVSHGRLRRGRLNQAEEARYISTLRSMDGRDDFRLYDAVRGMTVSSMAALIDENKPALAIIDGVYLMIDEVTGESNTPAALTNITRALKRLAQRTEIPIVISTQTLLWKMKGTKVSANSIGYSSSFFQDSDVILGLEEVEDEEEIRLLKIVASRNCGPQEVSLVWRWETGCFHDEEVMAQCPQCQGAP